MPEVKNRVTSKKPLVIVPVVLALVLAGLFLPVREVSIESYGVLSLESKITITIGYEVAYASPGWVSPTGFVDGGSVWTDEPLAYDEDIGNYAYADALKGAWTDYLELTHAALDCDKVQIWVSKLIANINAIEVDVYYSNAWYNIYSDVITEGQFVEYPIGSTQSVTAMRIRFYSIKASTDGCRIHEADFNEVIPADITNDPTEINFGNVTTGTDYWSTVTNPPTWPLDDTECYFTVTNNSSQAVNIDIRSTHFSDGKALGGWDLGGTAGEDIVVLKAGASGDSLETNMVTLTTSDLAFITALGASTPIKWELKMETPISFGNYDPKEATITLTATF